MRAENARLQELWQTTRDELRRTQQQLREVTDRFAPQVVRTEVHVGIEARLCCSEENTHSICLQRENEICEARQVALDMTDKFNLAVIRSPLRVSLAQCKPRFVHYSASSWTMRRQKVRGCASFQGMCARVRFVGMPRPNHAARVPRYGVRNSARAAGALCAVAD